MDENVPGPPAPPRRRGRATVVVLVVVVLLEACVIAGLGAAVAYLWGRQTGETSSQGYYDDVMMPDPEEEELWMRSEDAATEVGYMMLDRDVGAYLDLYRDDDPHVDLDVVQEQFLEAADEVTGTDVEFMSDMMPMVYVDEESGERLVRIRVASMDYSSTRPPRSRLTIYMLADEDDLVLTGKEDRGLKVESSPMF